MLETSEMTLDSYINVSSGRSFRGAIKSTADGPHHVIQLRDIDCENDKCSIRTDDLIKTEIKTNRKIAFLDDGDILMSSKGSILRAFILKNIPENTVCTQHFFLLKPQNPQSLLSEFIVEVINMAANQNWLHQRTSGSYQKMLTLGTLEKMPFPNMSLEQQKDFLSLRHAIDEEKQTMLKLIENRENQLASLIGGYIDDNH